MAQQTWTDTTLSGIMIKSSHVQELIDAIQAYQTAYGVTETTFVNDPIGGNILNQHKTTISGMKAAMDSLRTTVTSGTFSWAGDYSSGNTVRYTDIGEIRTNMNWLQDGKCIECHTCDTYGCSTCDSVCNAEACATCDNTCYLQTCTCNSTCYVYTCSACNTTCYSYTCDADCEKGNCGSEG